MSRYSQLVHLLRLWKPRDRMSYCNEAATAICELEATIAQLQAEQSQAFSDGAIAGRMSRDDEVAALQVELAEAISKSDHQALMILDLMKHVGEVGAELAEAREVPGRIAAWLRDEHTGKPVSRMWLADAIEARDWSKP